MYGTVVYDAHVRGLLAKESRLAVKLSLKSVLVVWTTIASICDERDCMELLFVRCNTLHQDVGEVLWICIPRIEPGATQTIQPVWTPSAYWLTISPAYRLLLSSPKIFSSFGTLAGSQKRLCNSMIYSEITSLLLDDLLFAYRQILRLSQ